MEAESEDAHILVALKIAETTLKKHLKENNASLGPRNSGA